MAKYFNIMKFTGALPLPIYSSIIITFEKAMKCILFMGFILFAFLIGYLLDKYMVKQWRKPSVLNIIFPIIAAILLFIRYGMEIECIKGLVLFSLLLFASNSDFRTREVSDCIPIMIAITALIGTEISEIPLMIFSAVFITLPQLVVAVLNENRYGGADIKIMAACAFLLGLDCGFVAVILGLTVALSTTFIITKKQKKDFKESFPVVPYLALGSFLAYMI